MKQPRLKLIKFIKKILIITRRPINEGTKSLARASHSSLIELQNSWNFQQAVTCTSLLKITAKPPPRRFTPQSSYTPLVKAQQKVWYQCHLNKFQ